MLYYYYRGYELENGYFVRFKEKENSVMKMFDVFLCK